MPFKERGPWHRQQREWMEERAHLSLEAVKQNRGALAYANRAWSSPSPARVTLAQMRALEAGMSHYSVNTRASYCAIIRAFLRWCGNRDALRWQIMSRPRPKETGIFLPEPMVQHIRETAHALRGDYELLYSLAVDNGCRLIDMERMTAAQGRALLSQGSAEILSKGRGGGKVRLLVLNQMTFAPLAAHLAKRPKDGPLFPYKKVQMWRHLKRLSREAQVEFDPHDLRRTFGNRHWRAGTPIETIARLMGHESVGMTFKAYIGVSANDMILAQSKLCPSTPSQQSREMLIH